MSEKDAKVWLKAEYGPDRLVPCKWKHTGQQEPNFKREVRTQAGCVSVGRRNFLIIGYATSPQIGSGICGGLVMVTWQLGVPPEKPKPRPFVSNGKHAPRHGEVKQIFPAAPASLLPCQ